ncbi:caspase family protein [Methylosinus sp. H3A]|uniref:caspase family protein n=1 Tax=Methylosinus sp. H3A TaxID=2785786 RepID=UPI0018C28626|nr:caspase family protein [Methylosinus sp. H3A]MBG0809496.1 caspase family protein [Methylosinus sp. H3A]
MTKHWKPFVLAFASLVLAAVFASPASAERRVALVLGNAEYDHIARLKNPVNDAKDVAETLEKDLGFEVISLVNARKDQLDGALADFSRKAAGADVALFYYAGHGVQNEGRNYLLPTDIAVKDVADVEFKALDMDRVQRALSKSTGVNILILDACRNNPFDSVVAARSVGDGVRGLDRPNLTVNKSAKGILVAYAAAPHEVALDGAGRNSPFAEALLKNLKAPEVEIRRLFNLVSDDVARTTKGRQAPEISSRIYGDFYFLSPDEMAERAWQKASKTQEPADFQSILTLYPTSPRARDAQLRLDLFESVQRCNTEQKELEAIGPNDLPRLRAAAGRFSCDAARKSAEALVAKAVEKERRELASCEADNKTLGALAPDDLAGLRAVSAKMTCPDARRRAAEQVVRLEQKEQRDRDICNADLVALHSVARDDLPGLRAVAGRLGCRAAIEEAKPLVAALEAKERREREVCETERKAFAAVDPSDLPGLRAVVGRMSCAAALEGARFVLARLEEKERRERDICDVDRKALGAAGVGDLAVLKSAAAKMRCEAVRNDANLLVAELESKAIRVEGQSCDAERKSVAGIGSGDLSRLRAAALGMKCDAAREDAKARVAKLEEQETLARQTCDAERKSLQSKADDLVALRAAVLATTCEDVRKDAKALVTELEKKQRVAKDGCDADRKAMDGKAGDLSGLRAALDGMSCESARAEARRKIAELEGACAADRKSVADVDATSFDAQQKLGALRGRKFSCADARGDLDKTLAAVETRVRAAQTQLKTLGCYAAAANGKLDEPTKSAVAAYASKKGEAAPSRLTDEFVAGLQGQTETVCAPQSAPLAAKPAEAPVKDANREEAAPTSKPVKHNARRHEDDERPARSGKRHQVVEPVAPRHMRERPAQTARPVRAAPPVQAAAPAPMAAKPLSWSHNPGF